ncbi:MAG: response regulator [Candidatus Andersenbacteria bacterium]|nr:response regulator [Candidatus Andersenbacteria bacterium]MBI3250647.1 response regulator [Candidatus Andersenbacteria bacterium]
MAQILLVEDDSFISLFLESKLKEKGHTVTVAQDTKAAEKALKSATPDLVLLDIILPDESGFKLLERMKAAKEWSAVPVVILSNLGQETEIEEGKRLGAVEFLVKGNYSPEEIVDRVANILEQTNKAV